MWFFDDWKDGLNPLLSMHDLFVTDKGIFEELQQGFLEHLRLFMRRTITHVERLYDQQSGAPYRWYWDKYLSHLDPDNVTQFNGILLLDSGGFVLGNPKSWPKMKSARNGRGAELAGLMAEMLALEDKGVPLDRYLELGREAQRIVFETGWAVKPDILITLDRVVHYEAPPHSKELYVQYNISNACFALKLKAEANGVSPMLWAVLHPWGPSLSELKSGAIPVEQAVELYRRGYAQQLDALLAEERRLGTQFDGFGLGSLVPISDPLLLDVIGKAVNLSLSERGLTDRPLHAFGSSERKARKLQQYGISSFDSTHHTLRARHRQVLHLDGTEDGQYRHISEGLTCNCKICSKHRSPHFDEFLEDAKGVKEVATVLIALHNLEMSKVIYVRPMAEVEDKLFPGKLPENPNETPPRL